MKKKPDCRSYLWRHRRTNISTPTSTQLAGVSWPVWRRDTGTDLSLVQIRETLCSYWLKTIKAPYSGHFLPFDSSIWHKDRICYNDIYHMSLKTMIISSTYHTVFMWISGLDCSNLRNIWVCYPCSELWQTVMIQVDQLGRIGQVRLSTFSNISKTYKYSF